MGIHLAIVLKLPKSLDRSSLSSLLYSPLKFYPHLLFKNKISTLYYPTPIQFVSLQTPFFLAKFIGKSSIKEIIWGTKLSRLQVHIWILFKRLSPFYGQVWMHSFLGLIVFYYLNYKLKYEIPSLSIINFFSHLVWNIWHELNLQSTDKGKYYTKCTT